MNILISIDAGLNGGLAFFVDGELLDWCKMPIFSTPHKVNGKKRYKKTLNTEALRGLLSCADYIVIEEQFIPEKVSQRGKKTILMNYGVLIEIARSSNADISIVSARSWKRFFKLDSDKQKSLDLVEKLYGLKFKKSEDGIAEAILIGDYERRDINEIPF